MLRRVHQTIALHTAAVVAGVLHRKEAIQVEAAVLPVRRLVEVLHAPVAAVAAVEEEDKDV